jgi:TM2 domain-containing membrane protein YozV
MRSLFKVSALRVFAFVCLAVSMHAQSPANAGMHYAFQLITLPFPDAVSPVYALGVNDRDDVVGYYFTPNDCNNPGVVCQAGYLKNGTGYHRIYIGKAGYTLVNGINNSGIIVGTCCAILTSPGFEYEPRTGLFEKLAYPGAQLTSAEFINNEGLVGGLAEFGGNQVTAFLFQNGIYTNLPSYPGSVSTWPTGLNSNNQLVGYALMPDNSLHGFLYQNGAFQLLDYPGAPNTEANGINDQGDVVGVYGPTGSTVLLHGFIYLGGRFLPFDQPGCSSGTIPQAINKTGVVVGETCGGAFIATPAN